VLLESVATDRYSISNIPGEKEKEKMLQKRDLSIMLWEQVLPVQTGFTARTMTTLAWQASSEQLWSWGEAASEGKVALQRQNQVSCGVMSACLSGEGTKGMVKCNGGSSRRWPNIPPHSTAYFPSVCRKVLTWGTLAKERSVDASTLASRDRGL